MPGNIDSRRIRNSNDSRRAACGWVDESAEENLVFRLKPGRLDQKADVVNRGHTDVAGKRTQIVLGVDDLSSRSPSGQWKSEHRPPSVLSRSQPYPLKPAGLGNFRRTHRVRKEQESSVWINLGKALQEASPVGGVSRGTRSHESCVYCDYRLCHSARIGPNNASCFAWIKHNIAEGLRL